MHVKFRVDRVLDTVHASVTGKMVDYATPVMAAWAVEPGETLWPLGQVELLGVGFQIAAVVYIPNIPSDIPPYESFGGERFHEPQMLKNRVRSSHSPDPTRPSFAMGRKTKQQP